MGIFKFGRKKSEHEKMPVQRTAQFSIWETTKSDRNFIESKIVELLDRIFDMAEGNELRIFNSFFTLNYKKQPLALIPKEEISTMISVPARDGKDMPVLITLSQERGVVFRFNYQEVTKEDIQDFLMFVIDTNKKEESFTTPSNAPTHGKGMWLAKKAVIIQRHMVPIIVGNMIIKFP